MTGATYPILACAIDKQRFLIPCSEIRWTVPPLKLPWSGISRLSSGKCTNRDACSGQHVEPDPLRLQDLVSDYSRMIDGTLDCSPFICDAALECKQVVEQRKEAIRRRWEEKRWSAAVWRDYQLECAQKLFEEEMEAAEREWEEERSRLKERLVADLLEERRRLMEELEPTLSGSAVTVMQVAPPAGQNTNKRSLRKRTAPDSAAASAALADQPQQALNGQQAVQVPVKGTNLAKPRRAGGASQGPFDQLSRLGIDTRLTEEDIYEDISTIYREDKSSGLGRRNAPRATAAAFKTNVSVSVELAPRPASTNGSAEPLSAGPEEPAPGPGYGASGSHPLSHKKPGVPGGSNRGEKHTGPKGPTAVVNGGSDALIDAYVEDSILYYGSSPLTAFQKSDSISVLVTQSATSFPGTISTITQNELWIRREDGTKNKIYLGQLRIGKYRLSMIQRQQRGQDSSGVSGDP